MKTIKLIFLLVPVALFFSCSPTYYIPNTHNSPMLSEKGEFVANIAGAEGRGEAQVAYAVSDNVGVMANTAFFFPKEDENGNGGKGRLFEGGVGYFTPVSAEGFLFETYALAGVGSVENHFATTDNLENHGSIKASLFRAAVQPAFGYKSKYFSASVSGRVAYLNYTSVNGDLVFKNEDQVAYLTDNNSHVLFEPALTLRGGIENVKVQAQIGTSMNLTDNDFRQGKDFITLGLHFAL